MKKIVVEVTLSSNKSQSSIMKTAAKLNGIKSMKIDEKGRLTIVGNVDPVDIIEALRKKNKNARIISVGPPELEKVSSYMHPYYNWSNASVPVYPYYDWNDTSYRPVQYVSNVPYEEQPSGCVIL